jgi:hypothetical protein
MINSIVPRGEESAGKLGISRSPAVSNRRTEIERGDLFGGDEVAKTQQQKYAIQNTTRMGGTP